MENKPLEYNYKDKDSHIKYLLRKRFYIEVEKGNFWESSLIADNFYWLYPNEMSNNEKIFFTAIFSKVKKVVAFKKHEMLEKVKHKLTAEMFRLSNYRSNISILEGFELAVAHSYPLEPSGKAEAYCDLGNSQFIHAERTADIEQYKETYRRYEMACKRYEMVVKYKHDYAKAYSNWGVALSRIAELTKDVDKYKTALKKFEIAIKYKHDFADAYYNWGLVLFRLTNITGDITKDEFIILGLMIPFLLFNAKKELQYFFYNTKGDSLENLLSYRLIRIYHYSLRFFLDSEEFTEEDLLYLKRIKKGLKKEQLSMAFVEIILNVINAEFNLAEEIVSKSH